MTAETSKASTAPKTETAINNVTIKTKFASCNETLNSFSGVDPRDHRIQLIAATPGSGNSFCKITLPLLTGEVDVYYTC